MPGYSQSQGEKELTELHANDDSYGMGVLQHDRNNMNPNGLQSGSIAEKNTHS